MKAALYNFLTADHRPQTAALEKDRRPRLAVRGQICKDCLNDAQAQVYKVGGQWAVR